LNAGPVTPWIAARTSKSGTAAAGRTPASGLQLRVTRCSAGFAACALVVYDGPVQITAQTIGALGAGQDDPLRLSVRLPSTGGNTFQGLSRTLTLTWTATQSL